MDLFRYLRCAAFAAGLAALNTGCMMMPVHHTMQQREAVEDTGHAHHATDVGDHAPERSVHDADSHQDHSVHQDDQNLTLLTVLGAVGMAAMMIVMML